MKNRLIAIGSYALFWILFFFVARLFFILMHYHSSLENTAADLFGTFLHGIKLDLSTTGYYMILPLLLIIPGVFFNGNWYRIFVRWYTYVFIVFSSVIIISDANLYSYWGFRMDYTPMLYLKTPHEAMASVSTLKIAAFVIAIILMSAVFIYIYNKLINKLFADFIRIKPWMPAMILFLVLWASLLIPIRGGFGVAPINAGSVYFSKNMFLNHTAINAVWNVGTSALTQKPVKNPYIFSDLASSKRIVDSLLKDNGSTLKVLNTSRPNIILIVLESFSGYLVGPLGGDSLITPNLNRYSKEGILFSEFYASGTRTDKAMPAILSGYPAQPSQSIIKEPKKSQSLPSLVRILMQNGYNTSFWYGGEINFANFNSFVIGSGFESIITKNNFDPSFYNSKWGVHDHIVFNSFEDSLSEVKEPFLRVLLTLSSHEPYDIPMEKVFEGSEPGIKYRNSVYYTDKVVGSFLDWAKQKEWWKNTLVVLVADHAARTYEYMPNYKQNVFKIPMLWLGGALSVSGIKNQKLGTQVDIPLTILNQMDLKSDFPFARDLFSDRSKSFAFYTYNEGFGFITDSSAVAFDLKSRTTVLREGRDPDSAENNGKAFLEVLFNDYLER